MPDRKLPTASPATDVDAFLRKVAATPAPARSGRGRLVFALDATASREATWRQAQAIQADMFQAASRVGTLDIQLVYYRGLGECRAGKWTSDPDRLLAQLRSVSCLGGETQIGKVLTHALAETARAKVHAVVFVGDCMEENVDTLCAKAGQLGVLGVPLFLFHEGDDPVAARAFAQMAKLSGGACCRFDSKAAGQLRELLSAVAVFAAGGRAALADYGRAKGGMALLLTNQMNS
ncbi:MAG: VWA domain-containing protein [Pseudomonadota bacterium]